jgi:hypothetical protein
MSFVKYNINIFFFEAEYNSINIEGCFDINFFEKYI